jgi:hemolysin-activating ACP:hemolysin acyltransferase
MWKKKKAKAVAIEPTAKRAAADEAPDIGPKAPTDNSDEKVAMSQTPSASDTGKASAGTAVAAQRTATVRHVDLALGQIVAVLMQSPQHKHYSLADLEWLVLPAVLGGQFRIAQAQQSGAAAPVGVALWATVSAEVDRRLSDLSVPGRLRPDEWRSGDIPWLMELVCDARVQPALLKDVGETGFKGRPIKMRVRAADGKTQIGTFSRVSRLPLPSSRDGATIISAAPSSPAPWMKVHYPQGDREPERCCPRPEEWCPSSDHRYRSPSSRKDRLTHRAAASQCCPHWL